MPNDYFKDFSQTTDLRGGGAASCIVFVEIKNDILQYYFNLGSYNILDDSDQILKFMLDDVIFAKFLNTKKNLGNIFSSFNSFEKIDKGA